MNQQSIKGSNILSITGEKSTTPNFILSDEKELSYRLVYYIWLSRLFILLTSLSLLFFMSASLALYRLAPMVFVEPFLLIRQDSSDGIVRSEPITPRMASENLLVESFLRQYVTTRNSFVNDRSEMLSRWSAGGIIHFLSSPAIFREFTKGAKAKLPTLLQSGTNVETEILLVEKIGANKDKSNTWRIVFKTYETSKQRDPVTKEPIINTRKWTSSVRVLLVPSRAFTSLRLINPIGFTVAYYTQSEEAW